MYLSKMREEIRKNTARPALPNKKWLEAYRSKAKMDRQFWQKCEDQTQGFECVRKALYQVSYYVLVNNCQFKGIWIKSQVYQLVVMIHLEQSTTHKCREPCYRACNRKQEAEGCSWGLGYRVGFKVSKQDLC